MPALLHVHGAARTVTGSCYLLEAGGRRILIDCGMFQGSKTLKELNYRPFPFALDSIDAMLLTHAHIDHSGLVPKLVKQGYRGPIHATAATVDLCAIMLPDSGHIQEMEVEMLNRRRARKGEPRVEPIYTAEDAEVSLDSFRAIDYGAWLPLGGEIRARFWNAGHMLGSSSIEIEIGGLAGRDRPFRLLMSGDLGPDAKLFHPDPGGPTDLDLVVCEATYGDRDRPAVTIAERRRQLAAEVAAAARRGGALLIPSFAVERTQEVTADLLEAMASGEVPKAPIFIDSPLAAKATKIFLGHSDGLEDGRELARIRTADNVHVTESADQSRALEKLRGFHVIIAASGMCDAGRIRHHLKNHLWRDDATVLMVGYQAVGTLGRVLQDGAKAVRIQGDDVRVRATIRMLETYSGHADRQELYDWLAERRPIRGAVALVHAEDDAISAFTTLIDGKVAPAGHVLVPVLDGTIDLEGPAPRIVGAPARPPRIAPEAVGRQDWHNDVSAFLLDLREALDAAADDRARAVILRRLKRALEDRHA
jgi:metallo-beta-lactamase family protein